MASAPSPCPTPPGWPHPFSLASAQLEACSAGSYHCPASTQEEPLTAFSLQEQQCRSLVGRQLIVLQREHASCKEQQRTALCVHGRSSSQPPPPPESLPADISNIT